VFKTQRLPWEGVGVVAILLSTRNSAVSPKKENAGTHLLHVLQYLTVGIILVHRVILAVLLVVANLVHPVAMAKAVAQRGQSAGEYVSPSSAVLLPSAPPFEFLGST
jgi:hypothetical protein